MNKKRKQPGKDPAKDNKSKENLPAAASSSVKSKRATSESDVLKADLEAKFLCVFPAEFFTFWKHVQTLAGKDNPCGVFESLKSLRLCGVFEYLAGHLKNADTEKCLLHDRHATDLPEMQTLAVYSGGRFVYWRDDPNTEKPLIVHVQNVEHFPKCVIVGATDPFYMVAHLAGKNLSPSNKKLFPKNWIDNYNSMMGNVKTVVVSRKKETVGCAFHGIGISVEVVDDIGYRPLTETPGKLKEMITAVATTDNGTLREKNLEKIMEIVSYVQFANDEKDFGMGLEFGHDLFWSNYKFFDKMAGKILVTVYKLLNRETFARILEMHMPVRRNGSG